MSIALAVLASVIFQTPGKLEIKDVVEGSGRAVVANDSVTVEYTGTLTDGKEFDSSKGKAPLVFAVGKGQVIKGWDDGLLGMKVGGERQLTVPPELAYRDVASGPIPANSTLKFDIKLLRIDREGDKQAIESTVLKPGTGTTAVEGDVMDINYTGTFVNGVKFDSSYDSKEPISIIVGHAHLIKGFSQGLEGIKEGEQRKIVVPPTLGYGNGQHGPIPGGSTLIFEIEATKITPKADVAKRMEEDRKKLTIQEESPGTGAEVHNGDVAVIQLSISLPGGKTLFDTKQRGQAQPYPTGSNTFKKGFEAALVGMKVGQKRKVTVPADLAFGAKGSGNGLIPPNSTVIFEIEVVKVNP